MFRAIPLFFVDEDLYLNGELLYEPYLSEEMITDSFKDFDEVPEGCYFVMGDNREEFIMCQGLRMEISVNFSKSLRHRLLGSPAYMFILQAHLFIQRKITTSTG